MFLPAGKVQNLKFTPGFIIEPSWFIINFSGPKESVGSNCKRRLVFVTPPRGGHLFQPAFTIGPMRFHRDPEINLFCRFHPTGEAILEMA